MPVNWKSTAAGIAGAFFMFVAFSPDTFSAVPWLVQLAKFAAAGGLLALGISAKDKDVTGAGSAARQVKE